MPSMTEAAAMTGPMTSPMILADGIRKRFGTNEVLKGVSLTLAKGEVVAVIGPSGSGKSTFLRCLNHLETIDAGRIAIEGDTLADNDAGGHARYVADAELRRICARMGMVFQHFNLFPHLTVLQNVIEAPITVKGMKREAILPKAEELLRKVGLFESATPIPRGSPAGRSSVWRSRARWRWSPTSCSSTSPPRPSTPSSPARSCAPCASSPTST